jgi:hypothetical protein
LVIEDNNWWVLSYQSLRYMQKYERTNMQSSPGWRSASIFCAYNPLKRHNRGKMRRLLKFILGGYLMYLDSQSLCDQKLIKMKLDDKSHNETFGAV